MSGPAATRALHERFESIRVRELQRLDKKLRGLTQDDRRSVEAITADLIRALTRLPEAALNGGDAPPGTAAALVRLFALDR
jgi:glutamyl-tRNA reductase